MIRVVHIVLEAQEQGEPRIVSVHRASGTARKHCVALNKQCNPSMTIGFNDYYVKRFDLEA
jgi:hypothetical protein